ncbi:hypothetical protein Halhy_0901 [Haliscomenobacter hydrossis DSM 1100]|uniref:Uncharacterized protein n=1 Tax=Haliscomenobacter hydrossis (strain ATCC 27775 / DSM 1100 / LMG 10767 / O) TaxID=760192 RepID=F4L6C0_HALH1|nr:hypothetical protein Halhy_0901 [Haliscomenobacter hydrossis DSM 1100]
MYSELGTQKKKIINCLILASSLLLIKVLASERVMVGLNVSLALK